jgi:hypothetical protein
VEGTYHDLVFAGLNLCCRFLAWICGRTKVDPPLSNINGQALFHPSGEAFTVLITSAKGHKRSSLFLSIFIKLLWLLVPFASLVLLYIFLLSLIASNLTQRACSFGPLLSKFSQKFRLGILGKTLLKVLNPSRRIHYLWLGDDCVTFTGCTSSKGKYHRSIHSGEFPGKSLNYSS